MPENSPETHARPVALRVPSRRAAKLAASLGLAVAFVAAYVVLAPDGLAGSSNVPQIEPLTLEQVAVLEQPLDLAARPGDSRLFVAERTGRVRVIDSSGAAPDAFLDLSDRVSLAGELGLLGIAFSPGGERLYANYTGGGTRSRLASWAVVDGAVDLASEVTHLVLDPPATHHNGGRIAFGPDGFLYWSFGDGGVASNAQDPTTRRGSILRISPTLGGDPAYAVPVSNPFVAGATPGAAEVWAYGLRNPWRFSFDRQGGDFWVADVGQISREEINRLPAGSPAGANFGWPAFEGTLPRTSPAPVGAIAPVHVLRTRRGDICGRWLRVPRPEHPVAARSLRVR